MYQLAILGVGKMGSAILNGIMKSCLYKKEDILLYVHSDEKLDFYSKNGYQVTNNVERVFEDSKIILLAIKPQMFPEVLEPSKKYDYTARCVISIAAGLSISYIEGYFQNAFVVRAMPNTPAQIGRGVTTVCSNDSSNIYFKSAMNIFNSIGVAYEIEEDKMDDSLALNGSMPAYLYLFAKAFIEDAKENGIDFETAKKLAVESIKSSCDMILESKDSIDTLITNVCSKGGTTLAGLDELKKNNFEETIKKCARACANRSKELSK
jgi:pyrroline-5-carboxylate reductase